MAFQWLLGYRYTMSSMQLLLHRKKYGFPVTFHFLLFFFSFKKCFSHIVTDPDETVFIIDVMFITMSIFLCSLYRVKKKRDTGQ